MPMSLVERITAPGPKKILSCDGGGIRGLMTVEILAKLEEDLRTRLNQPGLLLGDYFDFLSGTSTGAIIATCLAVGMDMNTVRNFYVESGKKMFEEASLIKRIIEYKYNDGPLAGLLRGKLNHALGYREDDMPASLGDRHLHTLLMMVMRNHSTDSPWPVSNNPFAKYNQRDRFDCNLDLPLWQLVRASTAAPTFFPPEVVTFGSGDPGQYDFLFVDGGVTTYNNPSFLAFEMATAKPYGINWATGVDQLLIVSVGTGSAPTERLNVKPGDLHKLDQAVHIPLALMNAATAGWDMACRILGECRYGGTVDREFGSMVLEPGAPSNWTGQKQFAYVRYDPLVSRSGLDDLGLGDVKAETMLLMDSVEAIPDIQRVGEAFAANHVDLRHLVGFV